MTDIDIVVHGATGFVGRLTAHYLATVPDVRVALSGRDAAKLEAVRDELGKDWEIITVDAHDAADMSRLAARTSVVISCVGPYTRLGEQLVRACAQAGTDYVDLCGEALFIRDMIDKYHAVAHGSGARIVSSCGFDSVPSDMGVFALHRYAGEPFREVTMVVEELKGGISGGTIDSMRAVSAQARTDREKARLLHNPYTLSPVPSAEPRIDGLEKDFDVTKLADGRWSGPFFMSMFNTRIVRRSNSLREHAYGSFRYHERWATGRGLWGRIRAYGLAGITAGLFWVVQQKFAQRWIPSPGEGPSEMDRKKGRFTVRHVGFTESGRRVTCTISALGDPGYEVTAMMLSQAALTLLHNPGGSGGLLTPATALRAPYVDRLEAGGMSFTLEGDGS
ncbi:Putative trans-acting enoyl reductase [Corynebacterium atrinae]|uniref:saccharopine dehydrogenase family protein n=1 Tax=Corynebacterium atrinae TaxID=1336740 RepID=UPI0025B45485|nr:saccharopine dehydrogenase NADP-binding domain-containing protein [Corynebacterium atrinae]WJY63343.1 Putative trans-acting enoyl reductase [Corynebacterium atrinae]